MQLKEHYDQLYIDSIKKISSNNYQIDQDIDSKTDQRFGITLLIRPNETVKNNIQNLLDQLKLIEPNQYYYPNSDIHITVMSIISCYQNFSLNQINTDNYIAVVQECLNDISSFEIEFKGITASPSCLMIQGFMIDNTLNLIREKLRSSFKSTNLEQSIDKRYSIQTAHSTIFRIKNGLSNQQEFLKFIEANRNTDFGKFTVNELELVYNDWYQRKEFVKKLHVFKI